jgi:hypothetical protein
VVDYYEPINHELVFNLCSEPHPEVKKQGFVVNLCSYDINHISLYISDLTQIHTYPVELWGLGWKVRIRTHILS